MSPGELKGSATLTLSLARAMVDIIANTATPFSFFRSSEAVVERAVDVRRVQLELVQDITKAGIDPQLFDLMLSKELDRTLKQRFAVAFFAATVGFTTLSFIVIVYNSIYHWGISDIAITGLVLETPLQFIGLLYIIARNLFPSGGPASDWYGPDKSKLPVARSRTWIKR